VRLVLLTARQERDALIAKRLTRFVCLHQAGLMGLVVITCVVLGGFSASAMAAPSDLDSTFGSGGKAIVDFGGSDLAFAAARQPDGKLLVAGETSAGATPDNFAVARLNPDGSPDAGFGVGGKATVDFGGGDDTAFAVAVQPDGKILLAGQTTPAGGIATFRSAPAASRSSRLAPAPGRSLRCCPKRTAGSSWSETRRPR